ncbi:MAG: phosphoribosylamine--glycine ligase [Acidobacteria bacterium]|nr:phosphoribosylamine--glycine ligase [Acidobacteriota bacterium]
MTRVVVVGSGAREHALAWVLSREADVVVTPGNDGMAAQGLRTSSASALELEPDLVVIGPEAPLVEGLADALRGRGVAVLGPGADGAQLEGSKAFMKDFLAAAGVPTARYCVVSDETSAREFFQSTRPPYVVKTDGLAAGKGVLVTANVEEALNDVREKLSGTAFGDAGRRVVLEEGLSGVECSVMVLVDGERAWPLATAQDFKRVGEGDTGPNTGGMGAYCPVPELDDVVPVVMETMVTPTLRELARRGVDYRGVLYAGVMVTAAGPYLLEYNVRFGDPETESLVRLYESQLLGVVEDCARGRLTSAPVSTPGAAVTVVLASRGYPEAPETGDVIDGLGPDGQLAEPMEGVVVFHAGTRRRTDGRFETNGGRVLAVSARATSVAEARRRAYGAVEKIQFAGRVVRSDIAREQEE